LGLAPEVGQFRSDRVSLIPACLCAGGVFASFAGGRIASVILGDRRGGSRQPLPRGRARRHRI
jgi:hypothetical protein